MIFYFAYGSTLDCGQMRSSCPSTQFTCRAVLKDHSLAFTRLSTSRQCGVADAVQQPGQDVWGVVHQIDEKDLPSMDRAESFRPERKPEDNAYYRRDDVSVLANGDANRPPKDPDTPTVAALKDVCSRGLSAKAPDHGLLSALHFHRMRLTDQQQKCLIPEAARSMALHHFVCEVSEDKVGQLLSWSKEPLACLLLLCDQLQTWDRERHDWSYRHDLPERAELSKLQVSEVGGIPRLDMAIDYIAPAHLERSPVIFGRVKDDLDQILAKHPKPALAKLSNDWPFQLEVACTMSGTAMNTQMAFPRTPV